MKEIEPRTSLNSTVWIPGSKSITHRSAIAASLATGESTLPGFLACADTLYTIGVLKDLGVEISPEGQTLQVKGMGGRFSPVHGRKEFYLGNSGTSIRLLLSTVSLASGEFLLTGSSQLLRRPIGELVDALNQLGVDIICVEQNGCPPVLIRAQGIRGGRVTMSGEKSSQYLSSLLLSGPYAEKGVEVEITGRLVSRPYVDITIEVMREFGVSVDRHGYRYFMVPPGDGYLPREFSIEGDVSAASYFWAAAAVTGGRVTTENIKPYTTRQGDIAFLEILREMGCRVDRETERVSVCGGPLSGIEADMSAIPDQVPTLASVALFANDSTAIRNVPHLRYKESDRLRNIALEWGKLGGTVEELADGLIIHRGTALRGARVESHDDHRLTMSLAVVGLKVPGVRIKGEDCVTKSFPRFWELWDGL